MKLYRVALSLTLAGTSLLATNLPAEAKLGRSLNKQLMYSFSGPWGPRGSISRNQKHVDAYCASLKSPQYSKLSREEFNSAYFSILEITSLRDASLSEVISMLSGLSQLDRIYGCENVISSNPKSIEGDTLWSDLAPFDPTVPISVAGVTLGQFLPANIETVNTFEEGISESPIGFTPLSPVAPLFTTYLYRGGDYVKSVMLEGKIHKGDKTGAQCKSDHNRFVRKFINSYGAPQSVINHADSGWEDPSRWVLAIYRDERTFSTTWLTDSGLLLSAEVEAVSADSCYLEINYWTEAERPL